MQVLSILTIMLLAVFHPSLCVAGSIYSPSGARQYDITPSGDIRTVSGSLIGRITESGDVRKPSGALLSRIREQESLRTPSGTLIARFDRNSGFVSLPSGSMVGRVENGDIRDRSGKLLGRYKNISDEQAALFYFFRSFFIDR
jgi:hypothetical protein